jgi:hypothetical protein
MEPTVVREGMREWRTWTFPSGWELVLYISAGKRSTIRIVDKQSTVFYQDFDWDQAALAERLANTIVRFGIETVQFVQSMGRMVA